MSLKIMINESSCFRCGICCKKYQVPLTREEVEKLAGNLGIGPVDFIAEYTDVRWPGTDTYLIKQEHGACIFLEYWEGRIITDCRIHAFRPQACRDWTAGFNKPECQQGRLAIISKLKN